MPVFFGLFLFLLIIGGGIVSIIVGVVVYFLSKNKRFKLARTVLTAVAVFLLIVCGTPLLLDLIEGVKRGEWRAFEATELVGTWKASYEEIGPHWVSGVETLILKADGTYRQIYDNGQGYVHTSPWSKWWLEDGRVIHLEQGRFYLLGIDWAEDLERGDAIVTKYDWRGKEVTLNGTEIVLRVWPDPDTPGGTILEHLPVGDPDTPDYVQFHRVATPVPESTRVP